LPLESSEKPAGIEVRFWQLQAGVKETHISPFFGVDLGISGFRFLFSCYHQLLFD
jgi:hypothetical protein